MGAWAKGTRRQFKWKELRFEVRFWTPVIFLAPPDVKGGPIADQPLLEITGSADSLRETMTYDGDHNNFGKQWSPRLSSKQLVHTADNEQSTWLTLLTALHTRELATQEWSKHFAMGSYNTLTGSPGNRTLMVFLQKKSRSWDTMPANVKKPYATTTICHLVEMAALLGLHWKEFNRSTHRYRAEGNGYILTGEYIADLGIMFNFQKTGVFVFQNNSLIPVDEIKDLCFGYVPTIFRDLSEPNAHLVAATKEVDSLEFLQMGTHQEISQTLALMGCNTNTIRHFKLEGAGARTSHLFPVAFEVVGLLARVVHIRHNPWRMLPNPTIYFWEKKAFHMPRLLQAFYKCVSSDEDNDGEFDTLQIQRLRKTLALILEAFRQMPKNDPFRIPIQDVLHDAIIEHDDYLSRAHKLARMRALVHIIRYHLQVVLSLMNSDDSPFQHLDSAQSESKEKVLMEIYFSDVRHQVLQEASKDSVMCKYISRVHTIMSGNSRTVPLHNGLLAPRHTRAQSALSGFSSESITDVASTMLGEEEDDDDDNNPEKTARIINDIWCTLIFRMLCWLTLHDFHKKDKQISKSELIGSRLPVYIA